MSTPATDRLGHQRDREPPVVGGADGEDVRPVGHQPADACGSRRTRPAGRPRSPAPCRRPARPPRGCARRTARSRPASPMRCSRSIMCSRCRGSIPLNGSSSSSTVGSWTSAAATRARWRMPLEYVPCLRCQASCNSTCPSARSVAARGRAVRAAERWRARTASAVRNPCTASRSATSPSMPVDLRVAPGWLAGHGQLAAGRREQARHHVQQRGLAGAVRAEQPGDSGRRGSC